MKVNLNFIPGTDSCLAQTIYEMSFVWKERITKLKSGLNLCLNDSGSFYFYCLSYCRAARDTIEFMA